MRSLQVVQRKQKLDALYKKVESMGFESELQSHWTRYLCILTAAFIESSLRDLYTQYAIQRASVTARFVSQQLAKFQNAKMERIYQLTGAFNDDWRKKLEIDTEGSLRDSIDSIVANRHNIAHGRDVNISFVVLKQYYEGAVKVIEMIDQQIHE